MGFSRKEYWRVFPFPSPGESSHPRDQTLVSCIVGWYFTVWATRVLQSQECSLGISYFLEAISSLSHSIVFLYFFVLFTEKGLLISSCYSLEFCIQMGISSLLSFVFSFSSFLTYLSGLLRQPFCLFAFLFLGDGLDHCLLYNVTNLCP